MSAAGPQMNGPASPTGKYIDHIDPDDPEYIKNLQRPAEVKEDLHQMENRSRVKVVLNSQAFKEELEQVVEEQLRNGPFPASLLALQQITDLLLPHAQGGLGSLARASAVIPINDLRGVESLGFAKGEKLLRCKLAALYRLVDLCGWSHGIHNHITVRVSSENEHFLLNPFGLTYSEITASSLIKVDVKGDVLDPGSTNLGPYKPGFLVHAAIHQARPDIKCIVHLHTPAAVAVSALKCGLLPMSQEALICGNISYHDFQGVTVSEEEREKLVRNLGVHNKVLVLRNRGILACGETIEEAFHYTFNVMSACETQVRAIPLGIENIVIPSEEVRQQSHRIASHGSGVDSKERKWKTGELEFEALMRTLDNSGYRTGYAYKMPVVKQEKQERSNSEVEIPPASSSFTYIFDGDYLHSKYASPLQAAKERQKNAFKAGWMTSPNAYKKTEIEEIGTVTPKKITKWVPEGDSPNRPGGTPIKIENPNQFAPQGDNPKEFKQKQKSIKKDYYEERITAGPQSKILEGITWDEAQKAKDGQLSATGEQLIVVGAASKGIIQRDHQHNAVVYRQYYAANPFENMSEAEIEQYQAEIQRKERGEPDIEEQIPQPSNEVATFEQPQLPDEPETQETDVVQQTRPQVDTNGLPETFQPQEPTGHDTSLEDRLLMHTADTLSCDTQAAEQHDQGQQMTSEANPVLLNTDCYNSLGSLPICDRNLYSCSENNTSCNNIQTENIHCERGEDCLDDGHSQADSWDSNKEHTFNIKRSDSIPCGWSFEGAETVAQEVRWHESETASSEEGFVNIQLNPIQLYHGQAESGVMKVRFSIQSIVRRRIRSELSRGGSIEEIYAGVSEPFIEHCQSDGGPFEYCQSDGGGCEYSETSLGHHVYVDHVNVKKSVRKKTKPTFYGSHNKIKPDSDSQLIAKTDSDIFENVGANNHWKHSDAEAYLETQHKIDSDLHNVTDATNVQLELSHAAGSLFGSEDAVRLDKVEGKYKHTPNSPQDSGGERKGTSIPVEETSKSKNVPYEKLPSNSNAESSSSLSYYPATPGREEEDFGKVSLPLSSQIIDEEDIKFADEELDDDIISAQKQTDEELKQHQLKIKTTFHRKDNWRRAMDRKRMPPPPLPPAHKVKNARLTKRGVRQRIVHTRPSLSPVKEELGATAEEMEEMEAILEAADDSFEQLLVSAEDDFLVSPLFDRNTHGRKCDFNRPLAHQAPMALEEDIDFEDESQPSRVTNNSLLFSIDTLEEDHDEIVHAFVVDSDVYTHTYQLQNECCFPETDHAESSPRDDTAEMSCNEFYEDNETDIFKGQDENGGENSKEINTNLAYPGFADVSPASLVTCPEARLSHEMPDPSDTRQDLDLAPATSGIYWMESSSMSLAPVMERSSMSLASVMESSSISLAPVMESSSISLAPVMESSSMSLAPVMESSSMSLAPVMESSSMSLAPVMESISMSLAPVMESSSMSLAPVMESSSMSLAPVMKRGTVESWVVPGADYVALLDKREYDDFVQEQEVTTSSNCESEIDECKVGKTSAYIDASEPAGMHRVGKLKKTRTYSGGNVPNKTNIQQRLNFPGNIGITIDTVEMKKHDDDVVCEKMWHDMDNNNNNIQTTKVFSDDVQHITALETNINNIEANMSSRSTESLFDDIISEQKEEIAVDKFDKLFDKSAENMDANIDHIVTAKNIETDINDIVPAQNIKTAIDDSMPNEDTETYFHDLLQVKEIETVIGCYEMPKQSTETDIDDFVSWNKIETVIDDIVPANKIETDIDDFLSGNIIETVIDDMPKQDTETDSVLAKKIEIVIDDVSKEDTETDIDDFMPAKKTETVVDDMPKEDTETDIDDSVPAKKIETVIDDVMPKEDTETDIDDFMPAKKIETVIDDIIYVKNTERNFDHMPGNKIKTNIDDVTPTRKMEAYISDIKPRRKANETEISMSLRKTETNTDDFSEDEMKGGNIIPNFTLANRGHIAISGPTKKKTDKIQQRNMQQASEGPIQTSSPKIGRAISRESPFKPYLQTLGKSEETLLAIMPLEGHLPQISAKSQEEIEDFTEGHIKLPLSRSRSLGPHHVNRKRQKHTAAFPQNARSKETLIDDFVDSRSPKKESFQLRKTVLDKDTLERHNAYMELEHMRHIFRPSVAVLDCGTGYALPPLPDTTEVPSVSDSEEQREIKNSKFLLMSKQAGLQYKDKIHTVASSESPAVKRKWVPKQKQGRRRRQQQDEGSVRDIRDDGGKGEMFRSVDGRRSIEQGNWTGGRTAGSQGEGRLDSSESMRDVRRLNDSDRRRDKRTQRSGRVKRNEEEEKQDLESDHTSRYDKQSRGKHDGDNEKQEIGIDHMLGYDKQRRDRYNDESEKQELESDYTSWYDKQRRGKYIDEKGKQELESDYFPTYDKQEKEQKNESKNLELESDHTSWYDKQRRGKCNDENEKQELESDYTTRYDKQKRGRHNAETGKQELESDNIPKYDKQRRGRHNETQNISPDYSHRYYNDGRTETNSKGWNDGRAENNSRGNDRQNRDNRVPGLPDISDKDHEREAEENEGDTRLNGKAGAKATSGDVHSGPHKYSRFRHKKLNVRSSNLLCLSKKTRESGKGMKEKEEKKSNATKPSEDLGERKWTEVLSNPARDGEYLSLQTQDMSVDRVEEKQNKVDEKAELRNDDVCSNQQRKQKISRSGTRSDERKGQWMERVDARGKWRNQQHQKGEDKYKSSDFEADMTPHQDKRRRSKKQNKRLEKHEESSNSTHSSDEETPEYEDHFYGLKGSKEDNNEQISKSEVTEFSRNKRLHMRQEQLSRRITENSENRKTSDNKITESRLSHETSANDNRKIHEKARSPLNVNMKSVESSQELDDMYKGEFIKKHKTENSGKIGKIRRGQQFSQGSKDDKEEMLKNSGRKNSVSADSSDGCSPVLKTTVDLEEHQRHGDVIKKRYRHTSDDVFYNNEIQKPDLNPEGKNKSIKHTSDNAAISIREARDARRAVRKARTSLSDKDVTDSLVSALENLPGEDSRHSHSEQTYKNSARANKQQPYQARRSTDKPDLHVTTKGRGVGGNEDEKVLSKLDLNTEPRIRLSDEAESRTRQSDEADYRHRLPDEAYRHQQPEETESRSRVSREKRTQEDGETPKAHIRSPETQKYAGFVKRSGRAARASHATRDVDISNDSRDDKYQESIGETHSGARNNRSAAESTRPEGQVEDLTTLLLENHIKVNIDDDDVENQGKPFSTRKGIFNLLSCVGGKSSAAFSSTEKHKKKQTTAYYDEGERWKVKKLSRSKDKGEKSQHYFDKFDECLNIELEGPQLVEGTAEDKSEEIFKPTLPEVKLSEPLKMDYESERYQKRSLLLLHKLPSAALDSSEAFKSSEADESLDEQDNDGSNRQDNERKTFGEVLIESAFTRPEKEEISSFSSFGKSNISTSRTKPVSSKYFHSRKISHLENVTGVAGEISGQTEILEVKELQEKSITNNDVENLSDLQHPNPSSVQPVGVDTLNDQTLPPEVCSGDEHPQADLAWTHSSIDQHQTKEHRQRFSSNHNREQDHSATDSLDEPRSFDFGDQQHGGYNKTDSSSDDFHPILRPVSQTSVGSGSVISRPRSMSSVTNPLVYDPWRSKVKKKKRSQSVSEMVYSRGVVRPSRAHSIGEVYNSTVASSVARRRARTIHSSDITSRMYQPRYHSRSHTSLADTSFSSAHPVRQRSFSGFDHSVGSPEPATSTVTVKRSESERKPSTSPQTVEELQRKNVDRSKSERHATFREELGDDKPASPSKSDTMKSTDSASGGETLEERSSKEGSPTKEHPSPEKDKKKKKKKFHIPSFSKKKNKESKGSAS